MCRPSYELPTHRRSRGGWPLLGILLPSFLCLSLLVQREPATGVPLHRIASQPQYRLELSPPLQQAWVGERLEIDLWVSDATPGLDMNQIEFVLEVTPGRVTIPDVIHSDPGEFIPDAFLVILDATQSEARTSAMYRIRAFTGGSNSGQGRLATLAFDAVSEGTAEILLSGITAQDSYASALVSPESASGIISIHLETTGLPLDEAYCLPSGTAEAARRPKRSLPARFEIDEFEVDDSPLESFRPAERSPARPPFEE